MIGISCYIRMLDSNSAFPENYLDLNYISPRCTEILIINKALIFGISSLIKE